MPRPDAGRRSARRSLALRGIPAVYLHGALGSLNDSERVLVSRVNRNVNRHYINADQLRREARDPESRWSLIRHIQRPLVKARTSNKAFHPNGDQQVLKIKPAIFSIVRSSVDGREQVICLTNVTATQQAISLPKVVTGPKGIVRVDLSTGRSYSVGDHGLEMVLDPYEVIWLGIAPSE